MKALDPMASTSWRFAITWPERSLGCISRLLEHMGWEACQPPVAPAKVQTGQKARDGHERLQLPSQSGRRPSIARHRAVDKDVYSGVPDPGLAKRKETPPLTDDAPSIHVSEKVRLPPT